MNPELTEKSPDGAIIIEHCLKTTDDDACGSCGFAARQDHVAQRETGRLPCRVQVHQRSPLAVLRKRAEAVAGTPSAKSNGSGSCR